jgi:AcrR family transcriptional regulator
MPRPRFQRAPIEKQEAILDAATREFATYGYDEASVNRILLSAGFSKGLFYYYFDDKADLAIAVIERQAAQYLSSLSTIHTPSTPEEFWQELARAFELHVREVRSSPIMADALLRLASALSRHPELLRQLKGSIVTEATARITTLWKRGQEVGAVRTDLPIAAILEVLQDTKITLIRVLLPADRAPTSEETERFARVHLDLIRRIAEPR